MLGLTVGETLGEMVGLALGLALGDALGDFDGDALGLVLGLIEGLTLGEAEGLSLGDVEGDPVGTTDGLMLGLLLGEIDGLAEGLVLGLALGDTLGSALGDSVGLSVSVTWCTVTFVSKPIPPCFATTARKFSSNAPDTNLSAKNAEAAALDGKPLPLVAPPAESFAASNTKTSLIGARCVGLAEGIIEGETLGVFVVGADVGAKPRASFAVSASAYTRTSAIAP